MSEQRAALPGFFRKWVHKKYPAYNLLTIDRLGEKHALALKTYPKDWRLLNREFVHRLRVAQVHGKVVYRIEKGLTIYWRSPKWLRRLWLKLVPAPSRDSSHGRPT